MADVVVNDYKATFDWELRRDGESTSRTFSIDNVRETEAGISSVREFRDAFLTGAGLSLSIVEPTKFWQPTGWRDNDPNEEPWETVGCTAKIVTTREYYLDGGDEGTNARGLAVLGADDSSFDKLYIKYDGIESSDTPPTVYSKRSDTATWNTETATWTADYNGSWSVSKVIEQNYAYVQLPPKGELPPYGEQLAVV